jgi:hypothetical protein
MSSITMGLPGYSTADEDHEWVDRRKLELHPETELALDPTRFGAGSPIRNQLSTKIAPLRSALKDTSEGEEPATRPSTLRSRGRNSETSIPQAPVVLVAVWTTGRFTETFVDRG